MPKHPVYCMCVLLPLAVLMVMADRLCSGHSVILRSQSMNWDTHTHTVTIWFGSNKINNIVFLKLNYINHKSNTLTLCVWLLQGSLSRSRVRLCDIPSRHCGRAWTVNDSSPYRLCCRIWGLEPGCHGNHWALMPRRRGMKWSPQETTAAAKTWNRKSVACRQIKGN